MLTRLIELMKIKCAPYYPEEVGQEMHLGEFHIKTTAISDDRISDTEKIIVRNLEITCNGGLRTIKHIHYADWPDRGVPNSAAQFICILSYVHQYHVSESTFLYPLSVTKNT